VKKRYRALYRYVRDRVELPDRTKVWVILYLADMESYLQTGLSLTGATWYKTRHGVRPRFGGKGP
jgi:hypothetical protein